MTLVGGIEAGGTKFVLGIGTAPDAIIARHRLPTGRPEETIPEVIAWFKEQPPITALGIGTFGPVDVDPASPDWGRLGATPKREWRGVRLASRLADALEVPVFLDTDVNLAGLAEARCGAGQGDRILIYVTVGTGIGGGAIVEGRPLRGIAHSEMGHIPVRLHPADGAFAGVCPSHGRCLEGLASGPAIQARWGAPLSELAQDHPAHGIIAFYLAQLAVTLQAILSPQRIIFGGGVMKTAGLLQGVIAEVRTLSAGYFAGNPADILVLPALGDDAGLIGALTLALDR